MQYTGMDADSMFGDTETARITNRTALAELIEAAALVNAQWRDICRLHRRLETAHNAVKNVEKDWLSERERAEAAEAALAGARDAALEEAARVAAKTVCDIHKPTGHRIYGVPAAKAIRAMNGKP